MAVLASEAGWMVGDVFGAVELLAYKLFLTASPALKTVSLLARFSGGA